MRLGMEGRGRSGVRPASGTRSGFTLIEMLVSFAALLVVLLGFTRMLLSSRMASSTNHASTVAKEAGRSMIETLEAADFQDVFALYNDDPADDPGGPGTAPGADFAVRGLDADRDDADDLAGEILFPVQGGELCETLALPQFGLPADLNGDGDPDDANVTDDYRLLPVIVRVEWQNSSGTGRVEFRTLIGDF